MKQIEDGEFGDKKYFKPLVDSINDMTVGNDWFLVANDFASYLDAQVRLEHSGHVESIASACEISTCILAFLESWIASLRLATSIREPQLLAADGVRLQRPSDCRRRWTRATRTRQNGRGGQSCTPRAAASSIATARSASTPTRSGT